MVMQTQISNINWKCCSQKAQWMVVNSNKCSFELHFWLQCFCHWLFESTLNCIVMDSKVRICSNACTTNNQIHVGTRIFWREGSKNRKNQWWILLPASVLLQKTMLSEKLSFFTVLRVLPEFQVILFRGKGPVCI